MKNKKKKKKPVRERTCLLLLASVDQCASLNLVHALHSLLRLMDHLEKKREKSLETRMAMLRIRQVCLNSGIITAGIATTLSVIHGCNVQKEMMLKKSAMT